MLAWVIAHLEQPDELATELPKLSAHPAAMVLRLTSMGQLVRRCEMERGFREEAQEE